MLVPELILRGKDYPSSLRILVKVKNKTFIDQCFGKEAKYFDVASLTKIMVTTPLCMQLFESKNLTLDKTVGHYLGFLKNSPVGKIKICDLLKHHSGLVAWKPFFKKVRTPYKLKDLLKKETVRKKAKAVYSDLDFIILGWIIEEILQMPLDEAAQVFILSPLKLQNTFFNPEKKLKKFTAPTRKTKPRGLIQGEVFDDNTWAVGGVSGQAGIFSTAEDVTHLGLVYLDLYNNKKIGLIKPSTLKLFASRALPKSIGDWGLGFTVPSRPVSTAGTKVSDLAFGHVGYTGTSLWIDPKREAVVTILSNGTYPNGSNENFKYKRRELHDQIWEMIDNA
jgi:CubicO group peptidase (beta-lactamase class C family)